MDSVAVVSRSASLAVAITPAVAAGGEKQAGKWTDLHRTIGGINFDLGSVIGAIVLFIAFLVVSTLLKRALRRFAKRNQGVNQSTMYTVERLLHYLLLLVGLLWALAVAGIPIAKMTVFAGALGVGLGFGLQAIFNDFVSGLILLFDRSLKVGDFVELASGVHGHVREIRIRATLISTNDDIDILVPNSEFVTGRVVNWTLREVARRQKIPFRVPYGTDKETVKLAALEAAAAVPFTLSMEGPREPQVWLTEFGESSFHFSLVVWLNAEATRRVGAVMAAYNWALHSALEKHGIDMPFPQRDVHLRSWVGLDVPESRGTSARRAAQPAENDAARAVERDIAEASNPRQQTPSTQDPDAR